MATAYGPSIVRNGLVLNLDAANPKSIVNSVEVLVVAGGGGSGGGGNSGYQSGGGGGGGVVYYSGVLLQQINMPVTVTVGQGGIAGTQVGDAGFAGGNGGNSAFGYLIATGGGGGGGNNAVSATGGSGGGGALYSGLGSASTQPTYAGATVYGNAGGSAQGNYNGGGGSGGGGGAGTAGGTSANGIAGAGGQGVAFSLTGSIVYYGGGGAGRGGTTNGTAINGATAASTAGAANTGAGGGGQYATGGMAGGSGIVIVRYAGAQQATGGTITTAGGYTTHVFTSSGTFTPTTWSNILGNGITGTLTNGPTFSPSNGGGVIFNGSNSYVDCGNSTLLQQSLAITMSAWVNPISSTGLGNIMAKNGNSAYRFRIENGSLWWYVSGIAAVGGACPNNVWSHCTVTGDSSGLKAYVNGVLTASNASAFAPTAPAGGNLFIGCVSPSSETFNGTIATAQLYNRALSATEILQNFNALRGRFGV